MLPACKQAAKPKFLLCNSWRSSVSDGRSVQTSASANRCLSGTEFDSGFFFDFSTCRSKRPFTTALSRHFCPQNLTELSCLLAVHSCASDYLFLGGTMKALRLFAFLLLLARVALADDPFASSGSLLDAAGQHHRSGSTRPYGLGELQDAAMQGNPEIRIATRQLSFAQSRVSGAGALDDPTFMYRDWGTPLKKPWDLNHAQNMFMFSQTIPGAGKRGLRSEIANKEVEAARAELDAVRQEIRARVSQSFYELLRNNDELRIHDEQVALARHALETARVKYTVGRVPQQDVLKAQVALTRLVEHLNMLGQEGDLARATLNSLLGRDPGGPLEVVGEYSLPASLPSLEELEKTALDNRPELLMYTKAIEQSEAKTRLAQKGYSPDYTVGAGYMLMPEGATYRNTYMAEFSLNLPWLNRRKHEAEIGEAQALTLEERAEYDLQRTKVFLQISEALIKARTAYRNLSLYRDTLKPQAEATLKAAAVAYKNDRTDLLNLLDSQNVTLDVESSYFKSTAEFDARLAELERAIGAPISRDQEPSPSAPEVSNEIQ
jgi:outer membrane protein TolC